MHPGIINYQCPRCMNFRNTVVPPDIHDQRVEASKNGIAIYSDIHRCLDGLLGIANIRVDANYSVRSVEYQKNVETKSQESLIPTPKNKALKDVALHVSSLTPTDSMRMILRLEYLPIVLNIGEIMGDETPIFSINSPNGTVKISYHESALEYTDHIRQWLEFFSISIEVFKPTELGLILEVLILIQDYIDRGMEEFDERVIRLIITAPEVEIKVIDLPFDENISDKSPYDTKDLENLRKIYDSIGNNGSTHLVELAKLDISFVKSIFYVLILEKENLIQVRDVSA